MAERLSFVLPITFKEDIQTLQWRIDTDSACLSRFNILFHSFLWSFDQEQLDAFIIVCPESDQSLVQEVLEAYTVDPRFRVVVENEFLPELTRLRDRKSPIPGWYIQQLIKLAAARVVSSTHYITLDSDIFCRKPFSVTSLIPDGKALLNVETLKSTLSLYRTSVAVREWRQNCRRLSRSATLLGYRRQWKAWVYSPGETPVVMHSATVSNLLERLSDRHGDWFDCLTHHLGWTEYTLLFVYLEMTGGFDDLYRRAGPTAVLDLDSSAWRVNSDYRHNRNYTPATLFTNESEGGPFVALQSYLPGAMWLPEEFSDVSGYYESLSTAMRPFRSIETEG